MDQPLTQSQIGTQILVYFFFSCLSYYLGRRIGLWKKKVPPPVGGSIWVIILGIVIVIGSAYFTGFAFTLFYKGENIQDRLKDPLFFSLFQCAYLVLSLILLFVLQKLTKLKLWETSPSSGAIKEFSFGVLTLIFVIPYINLFNGVVKLALNFFDLHLAPKQDVLQILENASQNPYACFFMLLSIVVLVPTIEEIVFRGLVQNWLKRKINVKWGLGLSIIIFTMAHFSKSHGLGNIEILLTLLVIAFFLTLIYEKRGTLWAPLGLHASFNALTSIAVIAQQGA